MEGNNVLQPENKLDSVKDIFESKGDGNTSNMRERKKSKKKHKYDSPFPHQSISRQTSEDHDNKACVDNEVEDADKGKKKKNKSVEHAPVEKNKSKKKRKDDSSAQLGNSMQSSIDSENNACFEVEHDNAGKEKKVKSVENGPVEKKKLKKKRKDDSLFADPGNTVQSSVDKESNACIDSEVENVDKRNNKGAKLMENAPIEKKKSKKKHKDGSSFAQEDISVRPSVDNEGNACQHSDKGNKKEAKLMENAPIEKTKSKKRRKDASSFAQQDTPIQQSVDNESSACIDSEGEHVDKGNKRKTKLMVNAPIEKRKSKKKHKDNSSVTQQDTPMQSSADNESNACFQSAVEHADTGKKEEAKLMENAPIERKKSKKKYKNNSSLDEKDTSVDDERNAHFDNGVEDANKGNKRSSTSPDTDPIERKRSKKKHKGTSMQSPVVNVSNACSDREVEHANKGEKKKAKLAENTPNDATPNKSKKKVRFSGKDDVFTLPADSNTGSGEEDNLVRGKRFTKEEDEILKQAVYHFIEKHNLGEEEGLDMVLNSKKHKEFRGCWREIGAAIPYRPYTSCYYRAQVLFRRSKTRKWTQEEYEMVLKYQEEHGNQWKDLAEELGKHRWHVKDTWRRIQTRNAKKGHWSQQEYQKLFDLVNRDLQSKVFEEKHSKHGMLRDNISWTAISDQVSTRTQMSCCVKWYDQLTSRMVAEGVWADADDYSLIGALYSLDANCIEDVDWDNILEHRSGDLCQKRWNQMVLHIGHHGNKSFSEQVEVLAQRYCPHLLEAREAWDNKPRVP